jgi:hypothetical protein
MAFSRAIPTVALAVCGALVPLQAWAAQVDDTSIPQNQITISCDTGAATIGINDEGNIIQYESPPGYEHIGVGAFSEGYVVRYDDSGTVKTIFDTGDGASGWLNPISLGSFVERISSDGNIRLTQMFIPDCEKRTLVIVNKLTNNNKGFVPLSQICFARQVDFDIDTGGTLGWAGFINNHAASVDSYFAWNDKGDAPADRTSHAMTLAQLVAPSPAVAPTVAKVTFPILDQTCPAEDAAPNDPILGTDVGGRVEVTKDALAPGESLTLVVSYARN